MSEQRPDWDLYFLGIAHAVSARATCPRKHVGAIAMRDHHILTTGYNGSLPGQPHCEEEGVGCLMEDGHCVRTIHAEANAILHAETSLRGATLYTTASPCWPCFKLVAGAGIVRVVFGEAYRAEDPGPRRVTQIAKLMEIELVSLQAEAPPTRPWPLDVVHPSHTLDLDSFGGPPWCTRCSSLALSHKDHMSRLASLCEGMGHMPRNGTCRGCELCRPAHPELTGHGHCKETNNGRT